MAEMFQPMLMPVPIKDLRPTQMTVGAREVALKRHELRSLTAETKRGFLGHHLVPAVLGPKRRHHIVDHHHLVLALHDEGIEEVFVTVICDLSGLDKQTFLTVLDHRSWMHPFDASGRRRPYEDIPKSVTKLIDDPYRSLAGEVRRLGGYAKSDAPFVEFLWADFFRRHIDADRLADDFERAARHGLQLARQREASYLPGWSGPDF